MFLRRSRSGHCVSMIKGWKCQKDTEMKHSASEHSKRGMRDCYYDDTDDYVGFMLDFLMGNGNFQLV